MMRRKQRAETIESPETQRKRQRSADTKYRHKVQFLYELLKENFNKNSTKEALLHSVLEDIKDIENDINLIIGPKKLADCRKDFLKILELEERIWKTEKDPSKWWHKVQEIINELLDENSCTNSVLADHKVNCISSATTKASKKKYSTRSKKRKSVVETKEAVNYLKRNSGIDHLEESIGKDSYEFPEQSEYLLNNLDCNM